MCIYLKLGAVSRDTSVSPHISATHIKLSLLQWGQRSSLLRLNAHKCMPQQYEPEDAFHHLRVIATRYRGTQQRQRVERV